jgi:hypothetical protein
VRAIVDAAGSAQFLAGLRWGGIAAAVAAAIGIAWRPWRNQPAPVAGLAAAAAATAAMETVRPPDTDVLAGLALLAIAGATFPWTRRIPLLPVVVALPGAWLIARSGLPGPGWVVPLILVVIAVGGPLISSFDENASPSPLPIVLLAISVGGAWATVPDTEEALVLLGAMLAPTLLAWPLRIARLGPVGAHALVAWLLWVTAWGGRGRAGSVIGAAAGLGLLVVAPLASWLAHRRGVSTSGWAGFLLIVSHIALVVFVTRVAGFEQDARAALILALPAIGGALLLWWVVERSTPELPQSSRSP